MVRRKKGKKKRPFFGVPKGIVLLATPEGWRTSVLTMEGGMLCGRLDVPINTDPQDARTAAAVMVTELARDFHDTDVEVSWDPPRKPWSWTAQVTLAADDDLPSPDAECEAALDEPLVADVGGHDERKATTSLLHRGPTPSGHIGPAVAAGTGTHHENAQIGHHRSPFRPEVVVDDLDGVPLEERPDM